MPSVGVESRLKKTHAIINDQFFERLDERRGLAPPPSTGRRPTAEEAPSVPALLTTSRLRFDPQAL